MFDLTRKPETTVIISGNEYQIDLSFDTVIRFYELIDDKNLESIEKIILGFKLFYNDSKKAEDTFTFEEMQQAINDIVDYIQSNPYGSIGSEGESTGQDSNMNYSYSQDAGAIYSSFMADYKIDLLNEQGSMHYLTFKALMSGLSEDTQFQRILAIRSRSIAGLEGEELNSLLELKNYYALDSEKTVNSLDDQLGDMFSMLAAQAKS